MLREEMARRKLDHDPIWVEIQLDVMERGWLARIRRVLTLLRDVRSLATEDPPKLAGAARVPIEDLARSDARSVDLSETIATTSGQWTTVDLAEDAGCVLAEARSKSQSQVSGIAAIEARIVRRADAPEQSGRLAVQVGSRFVGWLDADATTRFGPMVDEAMARGTPVNVVGYTARALDSRPPYVLALRLPRGLGE